MVLTSRSEAENERARQTRNGVEQARARIPTRARDGKAGSRVRSKRDVGCLSMHAFLQTGDLGNGVNDGSHPDTDSSAPSHERPWK